MHTLLPLLSCMLLLSLYTACPDDPEPDDDTSSDGDDTSVGDGDDTSAGDDDASGDDDGSDGDDTTSPGGDDDGTGGASDTPSSRRVCGVDIQRLTRNDFEDEFPATSDGMVVWTARGSLEPADGSPDNEIFLWDGLETRQLSVDEDYQYYPIMSGTRVVWDEWSPEQEELILWEDGEITQLTHNGIPERNTDINADTVVWASGSGNASAIYRYQDGSVERVSPVGLAADFPVLDGSRVVYVGTSDTSSLAGYEIYVTEGSETTRLTQNQLVDEYVDARDGLVTWTQLSPEGDVAAVAALLEGQVEVISDSSLYCGGPKTDGSIIAWSCSSATAWDIFWRQPDGRVSAVSSDEYSDSEPMVDGGVVAWQRWYPAGDNPLDLRGAIMLYDGFEQMVVDEFVHSPEVPALTQNPEFADGRLTWMSWDGRDDEIWTARIIFCDE